LKLAPLLGTVALIGVIIQVILGLEITGAGVDNLIIPHALIGVVGLIIIIILAITAFRAKTATIYSKLIITILTITILLQVGLGLQLLQGADAMITSHEANGFLILILTVAMGAVTMQNARKHP
jgi:DMSO/TMAO reductase YedYZ heme-binding membrane subunit